MLKPESVPAECLYWLEELDQLVEADATPTKIANCLAQLGLDVTDGNCDCELKDKQSLATDEELLAAPQDSFPEFAWLHRHHAEWNDLVLSRVPAEMWPKIRKVFYRDLRNTTELVDGGTEYSPHFRNDFTKRLLEKILPGGRRRR